MPEQDDIKPFMFLPYDNNDRGDKRPYPFVPMYQCPAILVNGAPYKGEPLVPGTIVTVSLLIANSGADKAPFVAHLYAPNSATAFTPDKLSGKEIGSGWSGMAYPTKYPDILPYKTPEVEWVVPTYQVCLVGEVRGVTNEPPPPPRIEPPNDRHYGQTNIHILTAKPGRKIGFIFDVVNLLEDAAIIWVQANPAGDNALNFLSQFYQAEAVRPNQSAASVHLVRPEERVDKRQSLKLNLQPRETRMCQLMIEAPPELAPHQFFTIEIAQALDTQGTPEGAVPTLGVVVFGTTD